jgi:hypothetical protein
MKARPFLLAWRVYSLFPDCGRRSLTSASHITHFSGRKGGQESPQRRDGSAQVRQGLPFGLDASFEERGYLPDSFGGAGALGERGVCRLAG